MAPRRSRYVVWCLVVLCLACVALSQHVPLAAGVGPLRIATDARSLQLLITPPTARTAAVVPAVPLLLDPDVPGFTNVSPTPQADTLILPWPGLLLCLCLAGIVYRAFHRPASVARGFPVTP